MWKIAIKMLMGDRSKYFTLVSSLVVVSFLFLQQGSIFCGLILRTARPVAIRNCAAWMKASRCSIPICSACAVFLV